MGGPLWCFYDFYKLVRLNMLFSISMDPHTRAPIRPYEY